jgi:hypothetical protein
MYHLIIYIPESHIDIVKNAIFTAGAGALGNYDQCCWHTHGTGQFRPLAGSSPAIGKLDSLATVAEIKLETLVQQRDIVQVISALKKAHPYEEPAYKVLDLVDV